MYYPAKNKNLLTLIKILSGLVFVVSIYAILQSGFRSYLILIIPLSLAFIWYIKDIFDVAGFKGRIKEIDLLQLGTLFLITLIVYILTVLSLVNLKGELYEIPLDYAYYSSISELLFKTGIETEYWEIALNGIHHSSIYHYFELWLGAAGIALFNITSMQSLMLFVFVLFTSLGVYGVYVILNKSNKFRFNYFSLSFIILIISPFYNTIRWTFGLEYGSLPFNKSLISDLSIKTSVVLAFLPILLEYRKSSYPVIAFIILLISLVYPLTIILFIPTLLLWLLSLKYILKYKISHALWGIILFIFSFLIISLINKSPEIKSIDLRPILISFVKENLLVIIFEPLIYLLYQIISFSPFLILLFIYLKEYKINLRSLIAENEIILLFLFICFILGSYGAALLGFTPDGRQFLTNFYFPLQILVASLILIKSLTALNKFKIRLFSSILLIILFGLNIPRVIQIYKKTVNKKDFQILIGKFSNNTDEIAFISTRNTNSTYVYAPYGHLRWYIKDYFPSSLSLKFLQNEIKIKNIVGQLPTNNAKYYNDLMVKNKNISEIISENRIRFLIVENKFIDSLYLKGNLKYTITRLEKHRLYEFYLPK